MIYPSVNEEVKQIIENLTVLKSKSIQILRLDNDFTDDIELGLIKIIDSVASEVSNIRQTVNNTILCLED